MNFFPNLYTYILQNQFQSKSWGPVETNRPVWMYLFILILKEFFNLTYLTLKEF